MNTCYYALNRILTVLSFAVLFLSSCKKDDASIPSGNETGVITTPGIPQGTATTKMIDANGGVIQTPDGNIKIEIPAGALEAGANISIQPITNTNTAGRGQAYRLSPHDVSFKKPVTISFAYGDIAISTAPEALGISYQHQNGVWMALGGVQLDKTAKTIKVNTTHFSDWSFFEVLSLTPQESSIAPSGTVDLKLVRHLPLADLLAPLVPGKELEIVTEQPMEKEYLKQWHLEGDGQLLPLGSFATYKAPAQAPAINPVTVWVELNLPQNGQFILLAAINIQEEGIVFRINGGPWIRTDGGMAQYFPGSGSTDVTGNVRENGVFKGAIEISWKGSKGDAPKTYDWSRMGNVNFLYRVPGTPLNTLYYEHYSIGNSWQNSPGKLTITGYGDVQQFVSGTFLLEKSGVFGDGFQTVKIEGSFRVKRVSDN